MTVTRDFKELVQKRVARDPAFADALLREGIDTMLTGDVDTGKAILRDYIKATVGFEKLGAATGTPAKSLIRMLGPRGNPQARNLFEIVEYLQRREKVHFQVVASIRRGLAQARKGMGRRADKVFDDLEQRPKPSLKTGHLSQR